MREPSFWWRERGFEARLLAPLAAVYGAIAAARLGRQGRRAGIPVVCIGNPTVGGAGKTPLALMVARILLAAGEKPVLLSRGYGGAQPGPLRVDPARHSAKDVGDEPLLLARVAPTIVARDRVMGAEAARAADATVIVMDDGFQNPSLAKDCSMLVIDGRRGVGNARVIPAGPLRAPLNTQLDQAHALIVVGLGRGATVAIGQARARNIPVFQARLTPDPAILAALAGGPVLAFAGIGDPEKFFTTLTAAGIALGAARAFPDHHRYSRGEMQALCDEARREGLTLITTEKDMARLSGDASATELVARACVLPVTSVLDDEAGFRLLLMKRITAARGGEPRVS